MGEDTRCVRLRWMMGERPHRQKTSLPGLSFAHEQRCLADSAGPSRVLLSAQGLPRSHVTRARSHGPTHPSHRWPHSPT